MTRSTMSPVSGADSDMPNKVGRYEVIMHLATGGMAQIYLAKAGGIGAFERYVVLKTILADRADDERFVDMFLDEARLAATLNHQNVAQVYEVDEADGAYFMAMEYVHGENVRLMLESTIKKGWTIPIELGIAIVSGAAAGLHHAHERRGKGGTPLNIVHRDVSPANIMVGYDGAVKVLDFGIAKAEERATRTVQGTIKGKYGYMSPEQCRGKPLDRRSDIFALGIVLYELTTLRRAFRGSDDFDTMKRIVSGDIVAPTAAVPGYPRELEAIVLTALAREPEFRYQTAQEMLEALDAFMSRARLSASPTALGRFMTQLFGAKREPWVERGRESAPPPTRPAQQENGEATEIYNGELLKSTGQESTSILDSSAGLNLRDTGPSGVHSDEDVATLDPRDTLPIDGDGGGAADVAAWASAAPGASSPRRASGPMAPPAASRPRPPRAPRPCCPRHPPPASATFTPRPANPRPPGST
jgi:serine/threonine protein kinase